MDKSDGQEPLEQIRERAKAAADFPLAEFAQFRGPDTKTVGGWIAASALDVPSLLAALDVALAFHEEFNGHCGSCLDAYGDPIEWPCGEYRAIHAALAAQARQ